MDNLRKKAFRLILCLGLISLLGDIIYEGGRGVNGQYLNILGVNASKIGFIVGLGELLGYFFRLLSGYFANKTKSYWLFTFIGYGLLISIPLISLARTWQIVALLIILERIGKGIRTPARDTIASHAAKQTGTGWGFGIAEFIDQIGAIIGPLLLTVVFMFTASNQNIPNTYRQGYSFFWIPFVLLILTLVITYSKFKDSENLEMSIKKQDDAGLSKHFWLYIIFVFISTVGFVNFALVGYHLKKQGILDSLIAALYALAMTIDAFAGLTVGKVYDRLKEKQKNRNSEYFILLLIPITSALVPFFVFSNTLILALIGISFLGFGLGVQETTMKAIVADITPIEKRASGYGIFNLSFGLALFTGSTIAGYLYDHSIPVLIAALVVIELAAIPIFYLMRKTLNPNYQT